MRAQRLSSAVACPYAIPGALSFPMSDERLPAGLRRRNDRDAILDDLAPYRGTTVAERSAIMSDLCRFAAEQIAAQPDPQRILAWQDPMPAESVALWRRLIARGRSG